MGSIAMGAAKVYGTFTGKRVAARRETITRPPRAGEREAEDLIVGRRW